MAKISSLVTAFAPTALFVVSLHAQGAKPAVAILPVSTTVAEGADRYAARAYEGLLAKTMDGLGRITVIDRTQTDKVSTEREAQKTLDFIDSRSLAAQGQSLGAQLVLTANVDKLAASAERMTDGSVNYKANLTVSVRLIDVATQEVKNSSVISSDASSGGKKGLGGLLRSAVTSHTTVEDAISAAVKNSTTDLEAFFREAFPARFTIAQIESISPDSNQATFLIDGGKNLGARPKQALVIIELSQMKVGDRTVTREKELGVLEITKLEGEELSIGAMKAGAKIVAQRIASGVKVYAIAR